MTTLNLDLWQRASHAQMGRGLDRANSESMQLRSILDDDDPIHVAFISGMGYILGLVYHELEYQHRVTKSRDFASVTDQALATLANLKEAAMPVKEAQVDQKRTEFGIATPSRRRAVRKSRTMSDLWPWYLDYRKSNPNARITCEPDPDGFYRVFARPA